MHVSGFFPWEPDACFFFVRRVRPKNAPASRGVLVLVTLDRSPLPPDSTPCAWLGPVMNEPPEYATYAVKRPTPQTTPRARGGLARPDNGRRGEGPFQGRENL